MMSEAIFSECGKYRYRLQRELGEGPTVAIIMVNPSAADSLRDDPTIRRISAFGKRLGWGRIVVVNKFAWITPRIQELSSTLDPVGPLNDQHITDVVQASDISVVAWGTLRKLRSVQLRNRVAEVSTLLNSTTPHLFCWGVTKDQQPRHPLFLNNNTLLEHWTPAVS